MPALETVAGIRNDHFRDKVPIKAIARKRRVSRNTVRKAEEAPREAHVPLAFDPGEAFQFDWSAETAALGGTPVKAGRRTSAFATAGWRSFSPAAGRAWDARGRAQPGVRVLRRLLPARDP